MTRLLFILFFSYMNGIYAEDTFVLGQVNKSISISEGESRFKYLGINISIPITSLRVSSCILQWLTCEIYLNLILDIYFYFYDDRIKHWYLFAELGMYEYDCKYLNIRLFYDTSGFKGSKLYVCIGICGSSIKRLNFLRLLVDLWLLNDISFYHVPWILESAKLRDGNWLGLLVYNMNICN